MYGIAFHWEQYNIVFNLEAPYLYRLWCHNSDLMPKDVADGPIGQVLTRPLFLKVETNSILQKAKKSTRVIFGLVQLFIIIMLQQI